jgi:GNAT superfamily N-acetyltransferase
MADEAVVFARTDLAAAVSRALISELNAELTGLYTEPGANHFRLDPDEVAEGRGVFLVAYLSGQAVGCGAFRRLDRATAELKRMYVVPSSRGQGLGRQLVEALEREARTQGVRRLVLETGIRQAAALGLYRGTGFQPIPLFGEYCLSPETSLCLGKSLADAAD